MGDGLDLKDIEELLEKKNHSYGNSVARSADMMRALFPCGMGIQVYHRVHFMIRIFDKLCRLASPNIRREEAVDAWKDIVGYGMLALRQEE